MDTRKRFSITLLSVLCLVFALSSRAFAREDAGDQTFLTAEQAFILKVEPRKKSDNSKVKLQFTIAPHHLLYQDHFKFRTLEGQPVSEKSIPFPKAISKKDDLGEYKVYKNQLEFILPLEQAKAGFRIQY